MTTRAKVDPGPCGFITFIEAKKVAPEHVYVSVTSDCAHIKKLSIGIVNAAEDLYNGYETSKVYGKAKECIKHMACPVPCAILKAVEVEAGLAVPKNVIIELEKCAEE
ncbi:MAG: hypothetical protein KO463_03290 [Candidatus Methanofastidiosa archaeon]|nr:hypothetical protein [Candidatus Methanofastidiosa archaeon]